MKNVSSGMQLTFIRRILYDSVIQMRRKCLVTKFARRIIIEETIIKFQCNVSMCHVFPNIALGCNYTSIEILLKNIFVSILIKHRARNPWA